MDKEVKAKWLEALRNGKYSQTKHILKSDTGMCCLGVLCDLYIAEHDGKEWTAREPAPNDSMIVATYKSIGALDNSEVVPPAEVVLWAGLEKENPDTYILPKDSMYGATAAFTNVDYGGLSLAELNDSGLTFPQIADVIEYLL